MGSSCSCVDDPCKVGVAVLSFAVLILATIVGIIFVLFWRGALVFITHDGERRFTKFGNALSIASNSSKTDQEQLDEKSVIRGEYVNFEVPKQKANQTQFDAPAASIGQNLRRHISNKSENSHFNTTSGNDIDGKISAQSCRDTVPRLLSQRDSSAKAKGLSYSFVDVTINKDGAEFTYDKARGFPDNNDKSTNPPAFEDNVYDRTKGHNETYDVTYLKDHVAINSNTYDHAKTLGGIGRPWNLKQNTIK